MSTQHTPRSAVFGKHCTHTRQRDDAIIHNGRDYVPTIYGQKSGNTVWVDDLKHLGEVGGSICFNEDQTEIHLTLPVGHKFSIQMFYKERAAPELLEALEKTLAYAAAMEKRLGVDDARNVTLDAARAAIAKARGQA